MDRFMEVLLHYVHSSLLPQIICGLLGPWSWWNVELHFEYGTA
jgi:hypothetical protein